MNKWTSLSLASLTNSMTWPKEAPDHARPRKPSKIWKLPSPYSPLTSQPWDTTFPTTLLETDAGNAHSIRIMQPYRIYCWRTSVHSKIKTNNLVRKSNK
jgi:hypothetical protein